MTTNRQRFTVMTVLLTIFFSYSFFLYSALPVKHAKEGKVLAISFNILHDTFIPLSQNLQWLNRGYLTANISLFIFWISLNAAGILKARWQMDETRNKCRAIC